MRVFPCYNNQIPPGFLSGILPRLRRDFASLREICGKPAILHGIIRNKNAIRKSGHPECATGMSHHPESAIRKSQHPRIAIRKSRHPDFSKAVLQSQETKVNIGAVTGHDAVKMLPYQGEIKIFSR